MAKFTTEMPAGGRGSSWQREETIDLLALWGEEKVQHSLRQSHKNIDVFMDIAKEMVARGHRRTAEECRTKTKSMRQMYKKTIAYNSKSGRNIAHCPYYDQLHQILRGNADVWPKRVAHSMVVEYETPDNNNHPDEEATSSPVLLPIKLEEIPESQDTVGEQWLLFSRARGHLHPPGNLNFFRMGG